MDYNDYTITEDDDGTFRVAIGDKVVNVGLNSEDDAKKAVDVRRRRRQQIGLEPAG